MSLCVWDEHQFWTMILQDHARFVIDFTSGKEKYWVETADQYVTAFGRLRKQLGAIPRTATANRPEMIQFAREAYPIAYHYYLFEGSMQHARLKNQVVTTLHPSYFTGTLGENREYMRLLSYYCYGLDAKPQTLIQLLDLWLLDQVGHSVLLEKALDSIEGEDIEITRQFNRRFRLLLTQSRIFGQFEEFTKPGFPRQLQLARDAATAVKEFYLFFQKIMNDYKGETVLTGTTLRFIEHHLPEACYFLYKLCAFVPDISIPSDCSLTEPDFPPE
ncbi:DUF2935 domain-containing protein [Hazenella sp. IB182357]|uniref:DUF2935 domain-containing protein n=1 Tax=Polycladospora coralii TaxID=2771432 RepID=A0A926NBM5_9BACL|nr:DUF2935 domain-containing protein [Polycladospora coralii]MBD1372365.1 DUF2935 domain-containing protein [Polycladospora coralii]MBS7531445.1 DUF2935 domain-containing protein [Polycladospora coralii]